jgi:hypothetical protein
VYGSRVSKGKLEGTAYLSEHSSAMIHVPDREVNLLAQSVAGNAFISIPEESRTNKSRMKRYSSTGSTTNASAETQSKLLSVGARNRSYSQSDETGSHLPTSLPPPPTSDSSRASRYVDWLNRFAFLKFGYKMRAWNDWSVGWRLKAALVNLSESRAVM